MRCLRFYFAFVVVLTAAAANAQVSLNSVRVAAKDAEALAKFYSTAFGMQETNRLPTQNGPEVFLNFGATAEAAKAAGGTVAREAAQFGTSGIFIAFVVDPEGNRIELIQQPKR